jgi:outer membrane receptor for ferric coprogen and ferric-rhodotorulic acid
VRDRGLEFELTADLSDHWLLRAGIGSLSSRYSSYVYHYGDPTSQAPPHTATFGVRFGLAQGWYGAADAYHAATATYYNPDARLPPYYVLAVRAGYRTRHWDTALIATNAFDADYVERVQFSTATQFGYRLGDPRRIELLVKRTW